MLLATTKDWLMDATMQDDMGDIRHLSLAITFVTWFGLVMGRVWHVVVDGSRMACTSVD